MGEISPLLVILFAGSVITSVMALLIHIDGIKHERDVAKINADHWKKMYEIRSGLRDEV